MFSALQRDTADLYKVAGRGKSVAREVSKDVSCSWDEIVPLWRNGTFPAGAKTMTTAAVRLAVACVLLNNMLVGPTDKVKKGLRATL